MLARVRPSAPKPRMTQPTTPGLASQAWPSGLPFLLPVTLLLLQAITPLVARISYKASPLGLPSDEAAATTTADSYHRPVSVALLTEALRCFLALALMLAEAWRRPDATRVTVAAEIPGRFGRAVVKHVALVLPATLYFLSNVLAMHAMSHLRSSVFSAVMNARILFAAAISVSLLHKHMKGEQWPIVVMIACAATVLSLEDVQLDGKLIAKTESIGMLLAVATALVSASAGVLAEKYLDLGRGTGQGASVAVVPQRTSSKVGSSNQAPPSSIDHHPRPRSGLNWEQQAVLVLFSVIFAVVSVLLFHADTLLVGQLFQGWNGTTVLLALLSAAQGLVVALTIQHCGVLTRLIIGSLAMCLCIVLEGPLFKEPVMLRELLAIGMVVAGSHLYVTTGAFSSPYSPSSSSYQPLQGGTGAVQHGSSGNREDYGQKHLYVEGKADTRLESRRGFSSLLDPFPFKTAADNSTSIKQLTALLVLALIYISVSSYVSVMLASGGLTDGAKADREAAAALAMLHTTPHLDELAVAPVSAEIERELVDGKEDEAALLLHAEDGKALSSSEAAVAGKEEELEFAAASEKAADGSSEELRLSYFASFLEDLSTSDGGILKAAALRLARKRNRTRATSRRPRRLFMNACFTSLRKRAAEEGLQWIIFPDLDEFVLSSIPGETLSDTLNAKYKGEACLETWRTWYGSSYRHRKPAGLVTETYLLASQDHLYGLANLIANINPEGKSMNATRLNTIHNFVNRTEIPCLMFENVKDVRIHHYLRSLQDYEQKAVYGPSQQERFERPFEKFWIRDTNTHLTPIAADYSCRVHALLEQMQEMQTAGKIPAAERPRPYNETHPN